MMAAKSDPQRRPVVYDLKNGRFLADPAIGNKYYPIPVITNGDIAIDLINTATSSVIAAARVVAGTTTQAGVLQLEDSVSSTSTSKAATPNAVKSAYDLAGTANSAASAAASAASAAQSTANAALPKSGGTMTGEIVLDEIKEKVYALGTSGTIALNPANGSIQRSILTGAPTFTDSLDSGQTVVLMLENGASYTVTWPTITWVTGAGNTPPVLTAKDTVVLWKNATTLYAAYVGSYA